MPPKKLSFIEMIKANGTFITIIIGLLSVAITIGIYQNKISNMESKITSQDNKITSLENKIQNYENESTAISSKLDLLLNYFKITNPAAEKKQQQSN